MPTTVRVAINLPEDLLAAADAAAARAGTTRSALMREALQAALTRLREQEAVERYVEGYRQQPEDAGEVAITAASRGAWSEAPWR